MGAVKTFEITAFVMLSPLFYFRKMEGFFMAIPKSENPNKQWGILYKLAEDFYNQHGHLNINGDFWSGSHRLGRWIGTQRQDYRKRTNPFFTQERIDLLEAIGMIWDVKEFNWQTMWEELKRYSQEYGTARVPQSYITPNGNRLGIWLNVQRMDHKKGKLLLKHKDLLEQLDVIWEPKYLRRGNWDVYFTALAKYVKAHKGLFPPSCYITEKGLKLGFWLNNQRSYYRCGKLLNERQDKLAELGFLWDAAAQHWEHCYCQAQAYYKKYGNLCLQLQRGAGSALEGLGPWLSRQRKAYHNGELTSLQIGRLEKLDMIWDVSDYVWFQMYREAITFFEKHGHLRVSKTPDSFEKSRLGEWISTQRSDYRKRTNTCFTKERINKLEAIGMIWDASMDPEAIWEEWYEKATIFFQKNGHISPAKGRLRTWVLAQRSKKRGKRGTLRTEQIQRLEKIGMIWEPEEEQWQSMYRCAEEYYKVHQILNVPNSYISKDGAKLGNWIARQRAAYKNLLAGRHGGGQCVMTPKHANLLNQIGMIWDGDTLTCSTSQQEKIILYYIRQIYSDANKISQWNSLGFELDIYIQSINTAIEYDGVVWHRDKYEKDEEKGYACQSQGIRLIRIREPGLPVIKNCDFLIQLKDLERSTLESAVLQLFEYLELPVPNCNISRDYAEILKTFKDYTSRKWDKFYETAHQYYSAHGHLRFSKDVKNSNGDDLMEWVYHQRVAYKNDELTPLQIQKLEQLGFAWNPFEEQWNKMYQLAVEYFNNYYDVLIPADFYTEKGEALGPWLANQREKYRMGLLIPRHIHLLERLNVIWNPLKNKQEAFLQAAKEFKNKNGHLRIHFKYITQNGKKLGRWISDQRSKYREGTLSGELAQSFETLGIQWNVFSDHWEDMFAVAKEYFQRQGDLWISPNYITPENIRLGGWISQQRKKLNGRGRSSPLTAEQKCRLDTIGMVWDPYTLKWMLKYQLAKKFYLENGHLHIPHDYVTKTGEKLGMWICSQRQALRGNPNFLMTKERKYLLDNIDMDWKLKFTKPNARQRK